MFPDESCNRGGYPFAQRYYKNTRVKQYHKEGRALRTETTINNARDFRVGKLLPNLPRLREIGFRANRRLLEVERITHDCIMAEETFRTLNGPVATGSGPPRSGSPIRKCRRYGTLWCCSGFRRTDSATPTCAVTGPLSSVVTRDTSTKGPLLINSGVSVYTA